MIGGKLVGKGLPQNFKKNKRFASWICPIAIQMKDNLVSKARCSIFTWPFLCLFK